jgi:pyruvyl transferase EpsO
MGHPPEVVRPYNELVQGLAARARAVLADHVPKGRKFALLDFPNHSNVGDSAIWLGELAALRAIGAGAPAYVCDSGTFSARALRERIGDGTVFIHGGGNLGDLWPQHQRLREAILEAARENPIVQLPQSIEFRDAQAQESARAVFSRHPRFTLLARDERSLERGRVLGVEAILCPDMAFCIPDAERPRPPVQEVQWLLRTDLEASGAGRPDRDWLEEASGGWPRASRRLAGGARRGGLAGALAQPLLGRVWEKTARQRLRRGLDFLARGRVVVTDRLHGHVLCLLMGIPHVVLPDRHGKTLAFIETWTRGCELFRFVPDAGAAEAAARELLPIE